MQIYKIRPVGEIEVKQAKHFIAREEEKSLMDEVIGTIAAMPTEQKNVLKNNFKTKWEGFKDQGFIEAMAELQLKAFLYERLLLGNKDKYPYLYNEYVDGLR
ncbi:MAG: hypothetical protein M1276_00740 [Deltaproteobacteria bacterium]|jgi:hypothetical protein|nr:hypothetical protein [Deltaproteobacteria bacterium]